MGLNVLMFGTQMSEILTLYDAQTTRRWPLVTGAVNHLKVRSCVIDGEVVCCAAQYKFGLGPIELAGWRHYSAIGLGEMAQEPRANQKKIEAEYKGATALPNKC